MIEETLRKIIEDKLNDNTKNKKFIVGQYFYNEDENRDFVYTIKGGYKLIEKNYIPAMISFSGEYEPIPNQINGYAEIGVEFLLATEDGSVLQTDLETLDEIKTKVIGNYQVFQDGSKSFESVWNIDPFIPSGNVLVNGYYYTKITTVISVDFSDTNTYGNAYKYSLTDGSTEKTIVPYNGSSDRENEENAPHRFGDLEAKGGMDESRWRTTVQVYVDSFIEPLVNMIASNSYDMTKVYTFKEYKYNKATLVYDLKNSFPIQISSMSKPYLLGEKQFITISMIKSDVDV